MEREWSQRLKAFYEQSPFQAVQTRRDMLYILVDFIASCPDTHAVQRRVWYSSNNFLILQNLSLGNSSSFSPLQVHLICLRRSLLLMVETDSEYLCYSESLLGKVEAV